MRRRQALVWVALATVVLATAGALVASEHPDGLERVAGDLHFAEQGETPFLGAPAPDYVAPGVEHPAAQTALAGVGGAAVVALVAVALGYGLRRKRKQ
jgi:ABC-type Fe3+ transport system permease subunit